jgi:hypothetical protein
MCKTETQYCDNCATPLRVTHERHVIPSLPLAVGSANEGESAVLCSSCDSQLMQEYWGPKCAEYHSSCALCRAWELYERHGTTPTDEQMDNEDLNR